MRKSTSSHGERVVKNIKRKTCKQYSAEEKIRIVLNGLRGEDGLVDRAPNSGRVWNKIPENIRSNLLDMALAYPELSPCELAARFTDTQSYFVSESSVYRLLKAHHLITSPAFIVMP